MLDVRIRSAEMDLEEKVFECELNGVVKIARGDLIILRVGREPMRSLPTP